MKNSSMYTAVAAFLAFVGAAVYAVLFYLGYLPEGFLFAETGVRVALTVLALLTLAAAYCGCKAKHSLHSPFACFGKAVIFATVVTLCVANLLLSLTSENLVLYTFVLFVTLFFWKFLLIMWGFMLAAGLPAHCHMDDNCCEAEATATAETTANCNTSNCCRTNTATATSRTNNPWAY